MTVAALVLLAVVAAVAAVGTWRSAVEPGSAASTAPPTPAATVPTVGAGPSPTATSAGDDAVAYASWLARALLTWDTADAATPAAHAAAVVDAADPPSAEASAFAADVAALLPTDQQWAALTELGAAQQFVLTRAWEPEQWRAALAGDPGDLPDGVGAVTVEGTRHRTGVWHQRPQSSDVTVTMTLFVVCPPEGQPCLGLRLSAPGRALR